jgi:hypothetical protein
MERDTTSSEDRTVKESLLENLRAELVARLNAAGFSPPGVGKDEVDRVEAACRASGGPVPPRTDIQRRRHLSVLSDAYFNVLCRSVSPRPRKVLRSGALQRRVLTARLVSDLNKMERLVATGEPLGLYQSKEIDSPTKPDPLLNMWGINHLHFIRRGDRVRTGNDLLFVVFQTGRALFVDIGNHEDFGDNRLVDIIDEDWPEVLGEGLPDVFKSYDPPRTSAEVMTLRDAGVMTLTRLKSGRLVMPTAGIATTGLSLDVRIRSDRLLQSVADLSTWLREDALRASDLVKSVAGTTPRKLKFVLHFDDASAYVVHDGTGAKVSEDVPFPPLPHRATRVYLPYGAQRKRVLLR